MAQKSDRMELENLCHNIIWLRKASGLSKKQMAALLEIGLWSLNKLERMEIPPKLTVDVLFNLTREFRIPAHLLLTRRLDTYEENTPEAP